MTNRRGCLIVLLLVIALVAVSTAAANTTDPQWFNALTGAAFQILFGMVLLAFIGIRQAVRNIDRAKPTDRNAHLPDNAEENNPEILEVKLVEYFCREKLLRVNPIRYARFAVRYADDRVEFVDAQMGSHAYRALTEKIRIRWEDIPSHLPEGL